MNIEIFENKIYLDINVTDKGDVRLLNLSPHPFHTSLEQDKYQKYRLVEVHESGMNQNDHHGNKHTGTCPGYLLKYKEHHDYKNVYGRKLEIIQNYNDLTVISHIQFYDGISVVRCWTELINGSPEIHLFEYVSSFSLTGLSHNEQRDKGSLVHIPHSTWYGEAQWKSYTLNELGYDMVNTFSVKRIFLSNTGTWAASEHLPMGSFENLTAGITYTWQIETSASWHWEISDIAEKLYLQVSGPTYQENAFLKKLMPGQRFTSVPCAVSIVSGDFSDSIRELTRYRRAIRRKNNDNENPSVIFNDYMNCLWGDPTTEKLIPLIDAASKAGCKYFCIDAGWYADGFWWDGVGKWLPSESRFPGGIREPLDYIRSKGMIPGLWLELEVMGIKCPLVNQVPVDWFFNRNGRPVIDEGRYQLDFRNKDVISHANSVIARLVEDYGVGYIKMDYNINAGPGTDIDADSPGDGLLQHTRAYLAWLDSVFDKYPELVIENCSSGGMRMEYSHLSRYSIQSVTDQTDYIKMAAIAANCMTAVTPEQAAIWSYPLREGGREEVIFNMVNAILMRIHQSGHLADIAPERFDLVCEGIQYHKSICRKLNHGLPFWPIGLASMSDTYICTGVDCTDTLYMAVWKTKEGDGPIQLPVKQAKGKNVAVKLAYPSSSINEYGWDNEKGILTVALEPKTARIFEFRIS